MALRGDGILDDPFCLVEAEGKEAMGRGMKSVSARLARAANRVFGLRGSALAGRYHLRWLRSPREARNAIAYVLLNARKHWIERTGAAPPQRLDTASSGRRFDGWRQSPANSAVCGKGRSPAKEVAQARTWLLRAGWRRWGLVDPAEVPG